MQTNIDIPSRASFPTNGRSKGFTLPEHSGPDKLAFTLVELIVVVVILGILSTVGFVSYSSYLAGTRDTNRISQLTALHDGLELYRTTKDLPLPDDYVEVKSNGTTIAYQGYAGEGVLETIDFTKGGKDPKDSTYFSYYLTSDKKYFQLMAFLEEEENLLTQIPSPPSPLLRFNFEDSRASTPVSLISLGGEGGTITPSPLKGEGWGEGISWLGVRLAHAATDYTNRYPTVNGHKLGILTESGTNAPIQEVTTVTNSGYLDIALTTDNYKANLTDTKGITGTGEALSILQNLGTVGGIVFESCKQILDTKPEYKEQDGVYLINPSGDYPFDVYCDMTTDGGGWTRFVKYQDSVNNDNVSISKRNHVSVTAYKIGLEYSDVGYTEILLNDCNSGVQTSILQNIPDIIKDEWVAQESIRGVEETGSATNSCNRTVSRKEGGVWYYGNNAGGADEFETMQFATQCAGGTNSRGYARWGAIDAGDGYRTGWGTVNGIDNYWTGTGPYHDDLLCAYIR